MQTDDTSSGGVQEVQMPSASLGPINPEEAVEIIANLAKTHKEPQEPNAMPSAVPLVTGEVYSFCFAYPSFLMHTGAISACQGCDLSGLLTFDPESLDPDRKSVV